MYGASKASRRKVSKSNGVDRISDLPEEVIIHILSLLPTTKARIRTEVLSKGWKHLWTCVPKLNFEWDYGFEPDDNDYDPNAGFCSRAVDDFVRCIDKTLNRILSVGGTKVKELRVKWPYHDWYSFSVDEWVEFAATNETEKFELDFQQWDDGNDYNGEVYDLPEHLYTNSYFRELRFYNCAFPIPETVSWVSLKKLTTDVRASRNSVIDKIVAGAPVLEFLDLQLHQGISKLDFSNSVVLKKFVLRIKGWDDGENIEAAFEIRAPSVESLQVSGYFTSCKLVDMEALVEATLFGKSEEVDSDYPILTEEVVSSLLNVKTLTVGTWVIQGIATVLRNDGRPLFPECKSLTVDTHLWNEDPSAIARLLKNTPQVETLIVTMSEHDSKIKFLEDYPDSNIDQYWTSEETASNYLTSLGTVKFIGFWKYRTAAFPFLQFLLKNATGLQKVVIDLEEKCSLHEIAPTELLETSQKLLSYPISSPSAKLLINP